MNTGEERYFVCLVFLAALILRLVFVIPSLEIPVSDAAAYDNLGLSISQGKGYINNDGSPHSFRPPFYPAFLAVMYKLFGHSYQAVRIAQSLLGAVTCVSIFFIGKKAYGSVVGILAASISVFYLPFIKSAELLLTELLFTFILGLIIFYLFRIRFAVKTLDCVIAGILLGLSALTRSMMLIFPLLMIPLFVSSKRTFNKKYFIILLSFFVTLLPWIIRNYIVYDAFIPVSTQGGITFYSSYCPPGGVFGKLATLEDPIIIEASRIKSAVLQNDFLIKKTIDFILNNPQKVLLLEIEKVLYLWAPFDWEIVGGRWVNIVYILILPFFAIGALTALKNLEKNYLILMPIIYVQITSLIFYGSPRFRLPIEPYIFILSMAGAVVVFKYFKKERLWL